MKHFLYFVGERKWALTIYFLFVTVVSVVPFLVPLPSLGQTQVQRVTEKPHIATSEEHWLVRDPDYGWGIKVDEETDMLEIYASEGELVYEVPRDEVGDKIRVLVKAFRFSERFLGDGL